MDQLSFLSKVLVVRIKEVHLEYNNVIHVKYDKYVMDTIKCTLNASHLLHNSTTLNSGFNGRNAIRILRVSLHDKNMVFYAKINAHKSSDPAPTHFVVS